MEITARSNCFCASALPERNAVRALISAALCAVGQHAHFAVFAACDTADGIRVRVKLFFGVRHMNERQHTQRHALVAHGKVVQHGAHGIAGIGELHGRNGRKIVVLVLLVLPAGDVGLHCKCLILNFLQCLVRWNGLNVDGKDEVAVQLSQFLDEAVLQIGRIVLEEQHPAHFVVGKLEVVRMELDAVRADRVLERVAALCYNTIRKQDSLWKNHLSARFGSRFVDEVSAAEVVDYLTELYCGRGLSYRYVESFLKQFYLLFGQAYSRNYLDVDSYNKLCINKDTKIHMPKLKTDDDLDIVAFSKEELAVLDDYFHGTNAETAYLLGRYCGLRINECYGLKWSNVDVVNGTILIDRQMQYQNGLIKLVPLKTRNAKRTIYMCDKLKVYFQELAARRERDMLQYAALREQNQRIIEDLGGKKISSTELVNCLPDGKIQTVNSMKYPSRELKSELQRFDYYDRTILQNTISESGLEVMSGDAIKALLTDATFSMRNNYGGDGDGTHTITFHGNGTVDASYTYEGAEYSMYEAWRMEGDSVVCTHSYTNNGEQKMADYYFTPYQYDETRYLLLDQNGDYSMILTLQ